MIVIFYYSTAIFLRVRAPLSLSQVGYIIAKRQLRNDYFLGGIVDANVGVAISVLATSQSGSYFLRPWPRLPAENTNLFGNQYCRFISCFFCATFLLPKFYKFKYLLYMNYSTALLGTSKVPGWPLSIWWAACLQSGAQTIYGSNCHFNDIFGNIEAPVS